MKALGIRASSSDPDLRMLYSYETIETTPILPKTINDGCSDVSKNRVDRVFSTIFGYSMLVDPLVEPAIEKSVYQCDPHMRLTTPPHPPQEGFVYRRYVDTRHLSPRSRYVDVRLQVIGDSISFAFLKERQDLFKKPWEVVRVLDVSDVLSKSDIRKILHFCREFGAHFADIDILIDSDGVLYVIDVNNAAYDGMFFKIQKQDPKTARHIQRREASLFKRFFFTDRFLFSHLVFVHRFV